MRPTTPTVRALTLGAVAVGLAALPYKLFELDRFFVPKEVALEAAALAALALAARAPNAAPALTPSAPGAPVSTRSAGVDLALAVFLVVSALSGALAVNGWLAARAVAINAAGVTLFWTARALGRAGQAHLVLRAAAGLVAVAAGTALLQTYGARTEYFSLNRAPGGTFGNRNFVAHLCAIGLPVLGYLAVRAHSARALAGVTAAFAGAAATLVLTRSRGAWLAAAVGAAPFALGAFRALAAHRSATRDAHGPAPLGSAGNAGSAGSATRWPDRTPSRRLRLGRVLLLVAAAVAAATAAVRLPNTLDWRSRSPYLDSARDVVNYREGSGQGRLRQWQHSWRLVAADPLLGVGPGHWSVRYPTVAPTRDPSLTGERTTANPWPSSD